MPSLFATAFGVGILGGIATWGFLWIGTILIWAAFIAWASFFAIGGDERSVGLNITSNAFGVLVAWIVALLALANPLSVLPAPVWVGFLVFVSVVLYVLSSPVQFFSSVPAVTLGYATTFAYLSQTPNAFTYDALLSAGFRNVLIVVIASMTIGTLFGFASAKLSTALATKAA